MENSFSFYKPLGGVQGRNENGDRPNLPNLEKKVSGKILKIWNLRKGARKN